MDCEADDYDGPTQMISRSGENVQEDGMEFAEPTQIVPGSKRNEYQEDNDEFESPTQVVPRSVQSGYRDDIGSTQLIPRRSSSNDDDNDEEEDSGPTQLISRRTSDNEEEFDETQKMPRFSKFRGEHPEDTTVTQSQQGQEQWSNTDDDHAVDAGPTQIVPRTRSLSENSSEVDAGPTQLIPRGSPKDDDQSELSRSKGPSRSRSPNQKKRGRSGSESESLSRSRSRSRSGSPASRASNASGSRVGQNKTKRAKIASGSESRSSRISSISSKRSGGSRQSQPESKSASRSRSRSSSASSVKSQKSGENQEGAGAEAVLPDISDLDDSGAEDDNNKRDKDEDFVSDFDLMLQRKKEEQTRRRKRKDIEIINDNDDLIAQLLGEMRIAAQEDRELNKESKPATKKIALLPTVLHHLRKHDLQMAFLECGVLSILTDWLAPMPDRSLPALRIRESVLKQLTEFPPIDQELLKQSGIGKAVMYLFKHPKETKPNKEKAGRMISQWARPIFNLSSDFKDMSKEERERRDLEQMPKRRGTSNDASTTSGNDIEKALSGEPGALRPGDPGWVSRARVPMPSTKDYVVRPQWNSEIDISKGNRKQTSRLDKYKKTFAEKKKMSKAQRTVQISAEGRRANL